MKKYKCHKIVEAASITKVQQFDTPLIVVEGWEVIDVPKDFFGRGVPRKGDYLVRYEPDGHLSWSPKDVFEKGYAEIPSDYRDRVRQERKELLEKADRLRLYMNENPDADSILFRQLGVMMNYLKILDERIAAF